MRFATEQIHSRLAERLAERERVARELHDTLLQGFQGLMLRFHLATQSIPEREAARFEMEAALDSADLLLIEGRDRIRDLRYESIEPTSLSQMISALGEDFAMPHTWELDAVTRGVPRDLNPVSHHEIYAVAKEAVRNAFRHSSASKIQVELVFDEAIFSVTVRDNGVGIDSQILSGKRTDHWGLVGMHERAVNLGSDLKISNLPGGGAEVKLLIPAAVAYHKQEKLLVRATWRQYWPFRLSLRKL